MAPAPVITLALANALGVILQPSRQRRAQAGFMRAAIGRRDSVAVGVQEAVGIRRPGHRPLRAAMRAGFSRTAGEDVRMDQRGAGERFGQIVLQPVGEMECRLFGHALDAAQQFLVA
jgi:hypothetical protein